MAEEKSIGSVNIAGKLTQDWGIEACEYEIGGRQVDLQDLLVYISKARASAIEAEIQPMSARMRKRNKFLEDLGVALSSLNAMQAQYTSEDGGGKRVNGSFTPEAAAALRDIGINVSAGTVEWTKTVVEQNAQLVKNKIDSCNNLAQTDMTRLQSLVDRRDQSYTAATDLMTSVSDTRRNLFGNI